MIHDPKVEVTCDGCNSESVFYEPKFVYRTYSGSAGQYDIEDAKIEKWLKTEDWIVDGDKQYCCQQCANDAK